MVKYVLLFQGLYYISIAIWSFVFVDGFKSSQPFDVIYSLRQLNAILFLTTGLYFVLSSFKPIFFKTVLFGFVTALLLGIVELLYIPKTESALPFWGDALIELAISVLFIILTIRNFWQKRQKSTG